MAGRNESYLNILYKKWRIKSGYIKFLSRVFGITQLHKRRSCFGAINVYITANGMIGMCVREHCYGCRLCWVYIKIAVFAIQAFWCYSEEIVFDVHLNVC